MTKFEIGYWAFVGGGVCILLVIAVLDRRGPTWR